MNKRTNCLVLSFHYHVFPFYWNVTGVIVGVSVSVTVIVMVLIIAPLVMFRQYKLERELVSQLWKISSQELHFFEWRTSTASMESLIAACEVSYSSF